MKIYLDNCCFNRPYDNQDSLIIRIETEVKLEIQDRVRDGKIELVWSYMMDYENIQNPFDERRNEIFEWRKIATEIVKETEDILTRMRIFEKMGIKSKDALHISCAIEANCDYFITVDKGILRKKTAIQEIIICNPINFIEEHELI